MSVGLGDGEEINGEPFGVRYMLYIFIKVAVSLSR